MNFKTTLYTIGFCLFLCTKTFCQIGIEDLSAIITQYGGQSITYNGCTAMPVTPLIPQKEYVCNWSSQGACNNSTVVYRVTLTPNQKGLTAHSAYVREGGWITHSSNNSVLLDSTIDQATINSYFKIKFTSSGFKVSFCNPLNFSKYNVNVTRCCRIITITTTPPPPPTNKVSSYPNPTNGTVNLKYDLLQKNNTSIVVFDKYNRLVKQVIKDEKQEIGEQNIQFDTYDLNDGTYYIRIQTGKDIVIKTMVVSKESNY